MTGAIERAEPDRRARLPAPTSPTSSTTPSTRRPTTRRPAPRSPTQVGGPIDAWVAGVGTTGTFTGVARYLSERNPRLLRVAVEPQGSILGGGAPGPHDVEGIGLSRIWPIFDRALIDEVLEIRDTEAFDDLPRARARGGPPRRRLLRRGRGRRPAHRASASAPARPSSRSSPTARSAIPTRASSPHRGRKDEAMGFSTDCIHAGNAPDPTTGAVTVPIYQTSTYVQEGLGKHKGYEYARTQNPTRSALEENLAVLEGGAGARAFASGMAAITAISTLVKAGDHVVCSNMTYGGTYRYYTKILAHYGVDVLLRRHGVAGRRRARDPARDEDAPPRVARPTRRCSSATSRCSRSSPTGTAPSSSSTTPSPRRTSRSRSRSARTSSCTRRRSS